MSLALADATGMPLGSVQALRTRPASAEQILRAPKRREGLYRVNWMPVRSRTTAPRWALLGDAPVALPEPSARYAIWMRWLQRCRRWSAAGARGAAMRADSFQAKTS